MIEKNKNLEDLNMDKNVTNCSKCEDCEFLKCFDYALKNYYCDHEDRTDDMGYVGVDNPPVSSPNWCPKREGDKIMSKELSIKGIKKDIIDKLLDSTYIVGLFDMKYNGFKSITEIKDAYIFDYARIESCGDFISVDISEITTPNRTLVAGPSSSVFNVSVVFGLNCAARNNENRLDNISEVIKGIIRELYPCNRNYRDVFNLQNIPLSAGVYESRTIRTVTFTIE